MNDRPKPNEQTPQPEPAGGEDPSGQRVGYRPSPAGPPQPGDERYGLEAHPERDFPHPTPISEQPTRSEQALTGQEIRRPSPTDSSPEQSELTADETAERPPPDRSA